MYGLSLPRELYPLAGFATLFVLSISYAALTTQPELPHVNVAFVGNSMMYYNDLPRLVEKLADGHMYQDSCLHGDATLSSILVWGNGMYDKWRTGTARVGQPGQGQAQYDFGACTVPQLLFGYDEDLETKIEQHPQDDDGNVDDDAALNADDFWTFNDGTNPCLRHDGYYEYLETKYQEEGDGTPTWDYVIMNDNTRSPARYESRQEGLEVLETQYLPWLEETGATPILISTYGYWSPYRDMGDLFDVPTFTSLTHEGYRQYAKILEEGLPPSQKPRIAKVGWAFLLIWEEARETWNNLFHVDKIHASPAGTYLEALIIHYTIFDKMPPESVAVPHDPSNLWEYARRFAPANHRRARFPTPDEIVYLYNVAVRICVYGHTPTTLTLYDVAEAAYYTPNDDLYRLDDLF